MISRIVSKLKREAGKRCYKREAFFPADRKVVSFTFDDFPMSAASVGGRILEENNMRGTYYASFGMSGSGEIPSKEAMIEVTSRGHELGCHTYSHIDCGAHKTSDIELDCRRNQEVVGDMSSVRLCSFAYPFGEYSPAAKKAVRGMFQSARTVEPGINSGRIDLMNLYAVPIDVRGGMELVDYWVGVLRSTGGWLIFFSHEICADPGDFGATEHQLSGCVDLCVSEGFEVMTVAEAASLCRIA